MKTVLYGFCLNGQDKYRGEDRDYMTEWGVPNIISESLDKLGIPYTIEKVSFSLLDLSEPQIVADITDKQIFMLKKETGMSIIIADENDDFVGTNFCYSEYERAVIFIDDMIYFGER